MTRLAEIIAKCRDANKKVLIFSQFRRVLETCRTITGEEAPMIHGDVLLRKRPEITRRFQEADGFAVLMQIDVGGEGLNLQAASVVILMEPQLKPSTEQQAVGRPHLMGPTRPVVVYRLIAADSIDERIVELSGFKPSCSTSSPARAYFPRQHPNRPPACMTFTRASCLPGHVKDMACKRRLSSRRTSANRLAETDPPSA
jgi:hypothetical protein